MPVRAYFRDLSTVDPTSLTAADADGLPTVLSFWVISDLHLGHERLEVGGPLNGTRPHNFTTELVARWNETVAPEDSVLVLGDVLIGWPMGEYAERMPELNGHIVVVAGNHESKGKIAFLKERGWNFAPPFEILYRDWLVFFTHEPLGDHDMLPNCISVHGHIHHHPERTPRHINTSAEAVDYRPVRLKELLDERIDRIGPSPKNP